MDAKELRQLSAEELTGRVRQWRDELFRARFKSQTAEAKDTSIFRKMKRDIARALTVLSEASAGKSLSTTPLSAVDEVTQNKSVQTAGSETDKKVKKPTKKASTRAKGSNDE